MHNIEIYEDNNGKSDIQEYILKLRNGNSKDDKIKLNKIRMYIHLLSEYGLLLGEPYIKHIKGDIWELRPIRNRIVFAITNGNDFVLLSIFVKKTEKMPRNEIEKAERLLKDYLKRRE